MNYYVTINDEKVVIGISALAGKVDISNMIEVSHMDSDLMFRKYENGVFSDEKYSPDSGAIELSRIEELERSQTEQDDILMEIMLGGM